MAEKLKDMFFTESTVKVMAGEMKKIYPALNRKRFLSLVLDDEFEGKEFMARMRHITECLRRVLPEQYTRALTLLRKAAPRIKGCEALCLPDFVECYGLDHWQKSLDALALFTTFSSSEFAVRPFIKKDPQRAMAFLEKLAGHGNEKKRRLASEGCRPRLPWASALPEFKKNPAPILPILEKLKDDESEFVRRSVANNLNDISKDHPDLVLATCGKWLGRSERTDRLVKHACRTMLKAGDSRAMVLFGFGDPKRVAVKSLRFGKKKIAIGEKAPFTFVLQVRTKEPCLVRLEYVVIFQKAKGRTGRKVFKISEKNYSPGDCKIARSHSFIDMSTRKHYPGEHTMIIVVNGKEKARASLILTASR